MTERNVTKALRLVREMKRGMHETVAARAAVLNELEETLLGTDGRARKDKSLLSRQKGPKRTPRKTPRKKAATKKRR